MTDLKMYLVGGAVRDGLLGVKTKDFDYTVTVDRELGLSVKDAYDFMLTHLDDLGFKVFLATPDFLTVRAQFPKDHANAGQTADFVLARREGPYSDGRRPDWVEVGTLEDDLSRRDFTVNAMAKDADGNVIDLFGGQADLSERRLRAVGDPKERLLEDPLRAYRAIRFAITKGFTIDPELRRAIQTVAVLDGMEAVSVERIREEMHRAFAHDTVGTVILLTSSFPMLLGIMERKGIWLKPTVEKP